MSEALLIAWALAAGVDWRVVTLLAGAMAFPMWGLVAITLHTLRNRSGDSTRPASFCQAVSRELRSGASLRSALADAAEIVGASDITVMLNRGEVLTEVAATVRREFPEVGAELESVIVAVAGSGSPSASLFEELGDIAMAQVEAAEEVRVATAPARASALVLVGLPIAYVAYQISNGGLSDLLAGPSQRLMAIGGFTLVTAGIATAWALVRRVI